MKQVLSSLNCAILHDSILEFGGAERVLLGFLRLFPNAHIYTLAADIMIIEKYFSNFNMSKFTILLPPIFKYRDSILQMSAPFFWRKIELEQYNLVLTSSAYLMSNIVSPTSPLVIRYIHSPPKNMFGLVSKNRLQAIFDYSLFIKKIYLESLYKCSNIVVNSKYTQNILSEIFGISSDIIYPPVEVLSEFPSVKKEKFYISVSRINSIKNIEIIIEAFNRLRLPLKIIGEGKDQRYLRKIRTQSGSTIEFLGFISDYQLKKIYLQAKALICASKNEDFGLSAVEAQSHGTPVIAHNGGGFCETIVNNRTGLLYNTLDINTLVDTVKKFEKMTFDSLACINNTLQFSFENFRYKMNNYVTNRLLSPH